MKRFFLLFSFMTFLFLLFCLPAGATSIRVVPITAAPSPACTPEAPQASPSAADSVPLSVSTDLTENTYSSRRTYSPVPTILPEQDDRPFIIRFGSRDEPKISLSMDDCYNIDAVRETLDLCRQYGIVMTFYPLGIQLHEEDRQLWQDIIDAGCEIGTHTMRHNRFAHGEKKVAIAGILRPQEVLDHLLGYHYPIRTIRTPYGSIEDENNSNAKGIKILKLCGYDHVVNWDVSQTDPEKALPRVQNGSILLYHARENDVQCIRTLIPLLLDKGFEFVTVAELIGLGAEVTTSTDLYVFDPSLY